MLDSLLQDGYVITEFDIRGIKVVLRSRFAWEDQEIFARIDHAKLNTAIAYQQRFTLMNLAASLVRYGTTVFKPQNSDQKDRTRLADLDERIEFIESLPTLVTDLIYTKWFAFNNKHGYLVAHFDELIKDF